MNDFGIQIVRQGNVEIRTSYSLPFEFVDREGGGGFVFDCDKDGNVDPNMNPAAKDNYEKCLNGTYKVVPKNILKFENQTHLCSCGSGEYPEDVYDARGIFVARVCDKCRKKKLAGYRKDIFEDSNYYCDEQIDEDY
jgi:hypothetical protein